MFFQNAKLRFFRAYYPKNRKKIKHIGYHATAWGKGPGQNSVNARGSIEATEGRR